MTPCIVGAMSLIGCVFVLILLWPEMHIVGKVLTGVAWVVFVGILASMLCSPEVGLDDLRRERSPYSSPR